MIAEDSKRTWTDMKAVFYEKEISYYLQWEKSCIYKLRYDLTLLELNITIMSYI